MTQHATRSYCKNLYYHNCLLTSSAFTPSEQAICPKVDKNYKDISDVEISNFAISVYVIKLKKYVETTRVKSDLYTYFIFPCETRCLTLSHFIHNLPSSNKKKKNSSIIVPLNNNTRRICLH